MKSLLRLFLVVAGAGAALSTGRADVDPKAVEVVRLEQIKWVKSPNGTSESAVLFGDPSKPGPYVMRLKWLPGNMSRPHTHATDRFFVVISGTWWVGSGTTFDPDSTVPVPAGSYVIHHAGEPHYDGAKGEETVIQVWGIGPLTTESAERKP
jgi:quercetin dioxygenase-like cupin family protein